MKLKLTTRSKPLPDIYTFIFEPLEYTDWIAGQYINITMPGVAPVYADRLFTIASAPHESMIEITTYLTPSPFKKQLLQLEIGSVIEADQIGGDFTYDSISSQEGAGSKRLFIAGGIGITPYVSIIRDRLHKRMPINATLLYAGQDVKRPYRDELIQAQKIDKSLKMFEYVSTRLTLPQLMFDVPNVMERTVYLAGSQKFCEDLGEGLAHAGLPREQVKYDYFDGYVNIEY